MVVDRNVLGGAVGRRVVGRRVGADSSTIRGVSLRKHRSSCGCGNGCDSGDNDRDGGEQVKSCAEHGEGIGYEDFGRRALLGVGVFGMRIMAKTGGLLYLFTPPCSFQLGQAAPLRPCVDKTLNTAFR